MQRWEDIYQASPRESVYIKEGRRNSQIEYDIIYGSSEREDYIKVWLSR